MAVAKNAVVASPIDRLKQALNAESVQEQFRNALQEGAPLFVASLIDVYGSSKSLQECPPGLVIMEALKAATLKLPINKNLGFAYIVPYKGVPNFQLGYKGYIQLAQRTGQYKYINADAVREGEFKGYDKLTGELDISGEPKSDKIVGYFAYIESVNGFRKAIYWTKEEVTAHARKYSKSFSKSDSAWQTAFDAMALKTVISHLIRTYGILSVEMLGAIANDQSETSPEERMEENIAADANGEIIDVKGVAQDPQEPQEPQASQEPAGPEF